QPSAGLPGSTGSSDEGIGSDNGDGKGKSGGTPPETPPRYSYTRGRGLVNTGNQCPTNSVLQVLRSNPDIGNAVKLAAENPARDDALAPALGALFEEMEREESGACEVGTIILDAINRSPNLHAGVQADTGEVLLHMLDVLREEAKRDKDWVTLRAVEGMDGGLSVHCRCSCGRESRPTSRFL
ncbi:unnamed protein product, partial [Laminaria digitata]